MYANIFYFIQNFAHDKYFINNYRYFYMNFLFFKIVIIIIITMYNIFKSKCVQ